MLTSLLSMVSHISPANVSRQSRSATVVASFLVHSSRQPKMRSRSPWRLLARCYADAVDFTSFAKQLKQSKSLDEARSLHSKLKSRSYDGDTFVGNHIIQMYGSFACPDEAKAAFDCIRHPNDFSRNLLLVAYIRSGRINEARGAFALMPRKDVVAWTSMIAVAETGQQALTVFKQMEMEGVRPDAAAFITALNAVVAIAADKQQLALQEGAGIHDRAAACGLDRDVFVGSAVVSMYGKCREADRAKVVFDAMPHKNVVSWTALLAAFAQNGRLESACTTFGRLPQRDVVSWNSIMAAHQHAGCSSDVLFLFKEMRSLGMSPGQGTFVSALDACSNMPCLVEGKLVHEALTATVGLDRDLTVQNALVNMYGKCGDLVNARQIFQSMEYKDVVSWTSMVAAYAGQGYSKTAMELFYDMCCQGIQPSKVTLSSLLSSCSQKGLVAEGLHYFMCLHLDYGLPASVEHYSWIIKVLGKAGQLYKAKDLIDNMPFQAWKTLLASLRPGQSSRKKQRAALRVEDPVEFKSTALLVTQATPA